MTRKEMIKKSKQILEEMGVYNKFEKNCKLQGESVEEALANGRAAIGYAFDWGGTSEGTQFWWDTEEEYEKLWDAKN